MKKMSGLAIAGIVMVLLNGCNVADTVSGTAHVYNDDLESGYMISGYDTIIEKDVDLCFYGDDYVYGRSSEYFDGTFGLSGGDIVFRDATDGGSYRLNTGGEIIEGYTYYFTGINNDIKVNSIKRSYSVQDCKGYGKTMRMASSLHLASNANE